MLEVWQGYGVLFETSEFQFLIKECLLKVKWFLFAKNILKQITRGEQPAEHDLFDQALRYRKLRNLTT